MLILHSLGTVLPACWILRAGGVNEKVAWVLMTPTPPSEVLAIFQAESYQPSSRDATTDSGCGPN
jgi:hypothetical protein